MKIAQIDPAPERRKGSDREPIFVIYPIEDLTIIEPRQIERAPTPPRKIRRSTPFGVRRWRAADLQRFYDVRRFVEFAWPKRSQVSSQHEAISQADQLVNKNVGHWIRRRRQKR